MPKDEEAVTIGKLGGFHFSKGYYIYVGSAKRNIQARVNRHIQMEKKKRWHIDYLRPYLQIEGVQIYPGDEGECELFQRSRFQLLIWLMSTIRSKYSFSE
ncbi:GIY-YIG nuclease family protein [Lederbergia sp. NSJ-179]|uniref:GIY-YIG nuclease family protein n=1 Tax=Lederbergia sp. NSJ-179 TaxID=2931402 RepID=UPI001FD08992|nr:GIY-YIG nuclease family protein [Lederbergia sp. NSJ-179]MCJ7841927.1 GIY-YIG nuclease family protein [Lederbergia sp. NSJ-179]